MKKIFTLAAMVCMAWSVNAQTETWSVANADGTLKAEYVANPDPNAASVVEFKTTNVTGTHVSGPNNGFNDAKELTDGKLLPKINNSWSSIKNKALTNDASVVFYYVQGNGNPVNDLNKVKWEAVETDGVITNYRADWTDAYYNPDGSTGLPTNGTYVTVKPAVNGSMKVAVWINKGNRDTYVVKASDAKAFALGTEVKASGYINGKTWNEETTADPNLIGCPYFQENIEPKGAEGADAYIVGPGNQPSWIYLTFDAVANETYYIFNKSTQIGFSGIEFTPAGESGIADIIADETLDENAPIYNVYGQRVNKDYKGILIQNGKKFLNR